MYDVYTSARPLGALCNLQQVRAVARAIGVHQRKVSGPPG